ncbi:type VI secretion system protein TssA [Pseudoduganella sp. GCM10020061]|uniref:type VI secretion system protein TssA n=1 Tax=Pseudoduganella sp. GCM10020061 TaxID=3317345 RepID=UPI0036388AC8
MPDLERILAPIAGASPAGEDISFSTEIDAIAKARVSDDPSLDQGAWETELREADWEFVARRCADVIATRSKDLKLAVWLAEALALTGGLRGLGDGLMAVAGLCDRFWECVHPQPDEDGHELRAGNLAWIAARTPQLLSTFSPAAGADALRQQVLDADHCATAIEELERVVDERLGRDGPGLTAAKAAMSSLERDIVAAARAAGAGQEEQGDVAAAMGATGAQPASIGGAVQSRAQALAQLRSIAEFFRRTEPHSPVAYLADKAAEWGAQPLHEWLRSVIKDPASYAHVEELLGVRAE